MSEEQPFLGDIFEEPPPKVRRKTTPPQKGVRWTRYKTKNAIHCDQCLRHIHEHWAEGGQHAPNTATARRIDEDGNVELLCWTHAQDRRIEDGLNPLRRTS